MRVVVLAAVACALALGGCRSDEELQPPDLSAPGLYCPPDPPANGAFVCDPTSIPYCSYPAQGLTCRCLHGDAGLPVLACGAEVQPDDGVPTGTNNN